MPPTSPHQIELTACERAALVALIRPTSRVRMVLRAQIVLSAADGGSNAAARPFDWKYTKKHLDGLLARIAAHEPHTAAAFPDHLSAIV